MSASDTVRDDARGTVSATGRQVPRQRETAYVALRAGYGLTADGIRFTVPAGASLAELLDALPLSCERAYICDGRPGLDGTAAGVLAWALDGRALASWRVAPRGHYLADADGYALRFVARRAAPADASEREGEHGEQSTGRAVEIRAVASWLGEAPVSPELARVTLATLGERLAAAFGPRGGVVYPTPGMTGLELWKLTVRYMDYPPLPDEVRDLITATAGQARIELAPAPGLATLPGLAYLDMRAAYTALCWGVGYGPVEHDSVGELPADPYTRGRYRVRVTVPRGWAHVGLLMAPRPDVDDGWEFPAEPGATFETWADGAELALVLSPPAGLPPWRVKVLERLIFTCPRVTGKRGEPVRGDPLKDWADRLNGLRAAAELDGARGRLDADVAAALATALRAIELHGIGMFHRGERDMTHYSADSQDIPYGCSDVRRVETDAGRLYMWTEPEPLDARAATFLHPEFSAAVWARCRVRLLYHKDRASGAETGALVLPRAEYVGARTDALYLAHNPGWLDDGKPGRFRLKGELRRPIPVPASFEALNALRDQSVRALAAEQRRQEARAARTGREGV